MSNQIRELVAQLGPVKRDVLRPMVLEGIRAIIYSSPVTATVSAGYAPTPPLGPIAPLDVEYGGVKLRELVALDQRNRRETGETWSILTPGQRAAVSAHWSAQLRARVASSAAEDAARRPSVVAELDDP